MLNLRPFSEANSVTPKLQGKYGICYAETAFRKISIRVVERIVFTSSKCFSIFKTLWSSIHSLLILLLIRLPNDLRGVFNITNIFHWAKTIWLSIRRVAKIIVKYFDPPWRYVYTLFFRNICLCKNTRDKTYNLKTPHCKFFSVSRWN